MYSSKLSFWAWPEGGWVADTVGAGVGWVVAVGSTGAVVGVAKAGVVAVAEAGAVAVAEGAGWADGPLHDTINAMVAARVK